jgi:rubredoxin
MTRWVNHDSVRDAREQLGTPGHEIWRTFFFGPPPGTRLPQAFLIEYAPGRELSTHFHDADEFQIVVAGEGLFGRHPISTGAVHFARAHTAYGPIIAGAQGLSFLTLRAQRDSSGPQRLPEKREQLERVAGRQPWQASDVARFDGTPLRTLSRIDDGRGLRASTVELAPHMSADLDAPIGDGRFIAVIAGSAACEGRQLPAMSIGFDAPDESSGSLVAGAEGLRALVLDFPAPFRSDASAASSAIVLHCDLCGFSYDESKGLEADGIAPGTRWLDVPDDWTCPDCSAPKDAFKSRAA